MELNQQIGEIRKELTNPQLAQQRYEERKEHYKIDNRTLPQKAWDTTISIIEIPIFILDTLLIRPSGEVFAPPRGPGLYEEQRHEAAKVSPTLVDVLENSNTEEREAVFRELIKGKHDLSKTNRYLTNWGQEITWICREFLSDKR